MSYLIYKSITFLVLILCQTRGTLSFEIVKFSRNQVNFMHFLNTAYFEMHFTKQALDEGATLELFCETDLDFEHCWWIKSNSQCHFEKTFFSGVGMRDCPQSLKDRIK